MLKKILLIFIMVVLAGYLVASVTVLNNRPTGQRCEKISLIIKDSVYAGFLTQEEIRHILETNNTYPVGKLMEEVSTQTMEDVLEGHGLIDNVECYKTLEGMINVEVTQRIPIMRVMASNGDNYYIDHKGVIMPTELRCIAHRVIASGEIEKWFATNDLYKFGVFLYNDKFWNAQIEQIHVLKDHNVELIPRVGDQVIYLGTLDDFEGKLKRLKEFYRKGLNKTGWNKYSRINVEFANQIICTKKTP